MASLHQSPASVTKPVLELLRQERDKALSLREWKFRLAGYGYGIKEVGGTQILTRLPAGTELGVVPVM